MPGILAFDQATKVIGWAYAQPGGEVKFGHKLVDWDGACDGLIGQRVDIMFRARVDMFKPEVIAVEMPYFGPNAHTTGRLYGVFWQIETLSYQHELRVMGYNSSNAVKMLTGRGKFPTSAAKKRATVEVCRTRGWNVALDDEADAIAGLLCVEADLYPEAALGRARVFKQPKGPLFQAIA